MLGLFGRGTYSEIADTWTTRFIQILFVGWGLPPTFFFFNRKQRNKLSLRMTQAVL